MSSVEVNKQPRQPRQTLSKITNMILTPSRVRSFIDNFGMNKSIEEKLTVIKNDLLVIKKEGGPKVPAPVEHLKKDPTKEQRDAHDELKVKHSNEMKKYNEFSSDRYNTLKTVYTLCKQLNKIVGLLNKKKRNDNQTKELKTLTKNVSSKTPSKSGKFQPSDFTKFVGPTDLTNPNSIMELVNDLKKSNPELLVFFQKDETSKSRVRFNDRAAVALAMSLELGLEELIEYGMTQTLKSGKKTLQPDDCVNVGMEKLDWFMLFRNLPHLRNIVERQQRNAAYLADKELHKFKLIQKAKSVAKKDGSKMQKPKIEYPKFQDTEVAKGFAIKTEVPKKDENGVVKKDEKTGEELTKFVYTWKNIDTDDNEKHTFGFYMNLLCRKVISSKMDIGESQYYDIKVSASVKKFLSDLVVDFIARISPLIRILISHTDVKTVDEDVMITVLRMMITDGYHNSSGFVQLRPEHERLFRLINEKIELCSIHQTTKTDKTDKTDKKEEEESEGEEDNESEDEETKHTEPNGSGKK